MALTLPSPGFCLDPPVCSSVYSLSPPPPASLHRLFSAWVLTPQLQVAIPSSSLNTFATASPGCATSPQASCQVTGTAPFQLLSRLTAAPACLPTLSSINLAAQLHQPTFNDIQNPFSSGHPASHLPALLPISAIDKVSRPVAVCSTNKYKSLNTQLRVPHVWWIPILVKPSNVVAFIKAPSLFI